MVDMAKVDRFDSDVLSGLRNLRSLAVETYPNIEKYRFRLGAVLSGIGSLEELRVRIREPVLSDQLLGGISPKLRKLVIEGETLTRIEPLAFDGLQNCLRMDLTISHTAVDEIPSKIFQLLLNAQWARLDLSHNQLSSFDSTALYPNRTTWYTKGTKLLQGLVNIIHFSCRFKSYPLQCRLCANLNTHIHIIDIYRVHTHPQVATNEMQLSQSIPQRHQRRTFSCFFSGRKQLSPSLRRWNSYIAPESIFPYKSLVYSWILKVMLLVSDATFLMSLSLSL